jgi:hypothetical protein
MNEENELREHQAEAWIRVCGLCMALGADNTLPGEVAVEQIENWIKSNVKAKLRAVIENVKLKCDLQRAVTTLRWYAAAHYQDDGSGRPADAYRRRAAETLAIIEGLITESQ